MRFKPLETAEEWRWFKDRTSVLLCEDMQGIVALQGDKIAAIVVFDSWTPESANVHMAIENPMAIRAGLFSEVAYHAYVKNNRKRLFGLVPSNNERALKTNAKIGFREVARVPDALATGVDYIVMRLDRDECEWLPGRLRETA